MRRKIHQFTSSYSLMDSKYYQDFLEPFKNAYHLMNLPDKGLIENLIFWGSLGVILEFSIY